MRRLTLPRLAVALVFLGLLAMATRAAVDTDTWWHLRAGTWMLEHGQVLTHDEFSLTRLGQPWLNVNWLSQIILALIFQAAGVPGLNLLVAVLVPLAFVFVYWQCEGSVYLRAFVLVLAAAASAVYWTARPQMASLLLASVFAYVLAEYRWHGRNRLWALPPLMLLWANLHGGFAIGFLLLAATLAGQVVSRALGPERPGVLPWRGIGAMAVTALVCALAVMVNPVGPRLLWFPLQTVSIGVLQDFIQEWQSPNFHIIAVQPFLWLMLATFAAVGLGRKRIDLTDLLLFGGFTSLALLGGRNISIAALLAPPIILRHVAAAVAELRERQPRLAAVLDPPPSPNRFPLLNWVLLGLVALVVVVKTAVVDSPATTALAVRLQAPVAAAEFLERERPAGPLFNAYNWGGYLSWRLYPQYLVFVDGRTDLYEDELLRAALGAAVGLEGYADLLDEYGINLVLIETGSPLLARLEQDGGWQSIYADTMATIYQRTTPTSQP